MAPRIGRVMQLDVYRKDWRTL